MNAEHLANIKNELAVQVSTQKIKSEILSQFLNLIGSNIKQDVLNKSDDTGFLLKSLFTIENRDYTLMGMNYCPGGELYAKLK